MDTVDTSRYRVPALTADNYFMWSHKVELILRGKGLWDIVSGKETAPSDDTERTNYERRRDVALTNIILTIDDSCIAAVITLRDPKEVWDTLKKMYKTVSEARIDAYIVQFQQLKMKPTEKVMEYINRLSVIENKLAGVGHTIPSSDKRRTLLRGLRKEFPITAGIVKATDKDFNEAVAALVTQEAEIEGEVYDSGNENTALQVHNETKCGFCGKQNHSTQNCFFNPDGENYKPQLSNKRVDRRRSRGNLKTGNVGARHNRRDNNSAYANVSIIAKCNRAMTALKNDTSSDWYIDSGASAHMCNNPSLFTSLQDISSEDTVSVGNGEETEVTGIGTVLCSSVVDGNQKTVELKNVLYVPSLMCNLISVSRIRKAGLRVIVDTDEYGGGFCDVTTRNGDVKYLKGIELHDTGLYKAVMKPVKESGGTALAAPVNTGLTWHERLGHASESTLQNTIPLVNGLKLEKVGKLPHCEACKLGKSTRAPRPLASKESRMATKPLELVHTDLVGPMRHPSLNGSRYFIPVYDDSSGLSLVKFLKRKSEAGQALKDMILEMETALNCQVQQLRVQRVRSDNAKEFLSKQVIDWLKAKGIQQELSPPYSPESNGKAERLNRTLIDMARTMLMGAKNLPLHPKLWAEAVHTANYIRNRLFTAASNDPSKTPYEIIMGKKPNLSHIRKFGAKAYVHIPKTKRETKFEQRADVGYCVGFTAGNGYRIFLPESCKVVVSRDVQFDERPGELTNSNQDSTVEPSTILEDLSERFNQVDTTVTRNEEQRDESDAEESPEAVRDREDQEIADQEEDTSSPKEIVTRNPGLRRSSRTSKIPQRYTPGTSKTMIALLNRIGNKDSQVPLTYNQTVDSTDSNKWKRAADEDINQVSTETWKLVPLPPGSKAVKSKWVNTKKNPPTVKHKYIVKNLGMAQGKDLKRTDEAETQG